MEKNVHGFAVRLKNVTYFYQTDDSHPDTLLARRFHNRYTPAEYDSLGLPLSYDCRERLGTRFSIDGLCEKHWSAIVLE